MLTPSTADLPDIIATTASWQREGLPVQVHPGDLGWYQRFGADALAGALRVWTIGDEIAAIGFLDETELIRMAIAPDHADDKTIADAIVSDLVGDLSDLLPAGTGIAEARFGPALQTALAEAGWTSDEPWTLLHRSLDDPIPPVSLTIDVVEPGNIDDRITVEASAFPGASLTHDRWQDMAAGCAYRQARCLVGYTSDGEAAGATTVWSAGPGRPGIIEPLGVHSDHRGLGFGVDMARAAAAALRDMGASSITVATPSSNTAAVAAYRSAGMSILGEVMDFRRPDHIRSERIR
ncbi:GNAT family N-acetyltransferase [Brevibacterium spongiae]|uniref:GNAT family N-acetyltransferase n=1 Tax=Brevibacterium spongiae TaxID=2909672 RepID=A0ABY5SSG6_9MICO|nr:GNAT family N-acetyltransferase [Brevibacterium spongiae]UVI37487.1 GNAT family N-acetyltransferase [Brevibacterium spongiae]